MPKRKIRRRNRKTRVQFAPRFDLKRWLERKRRTLKIARA